jgi:hypothetical protein
MIIPAPQGLAPEEHRLQAVLALFRGEKASDVSTSFGICRSDLYKLRTRALAARTPPAPRAGALVSPALTRVARIRHK